MPGLKTQIKQRLKRILFPVKWHQLRTLTPISNVFGLDRGTPIDRYYIENFLQKNSDRIQGVVLEIAENTYSKRFGGDKVTDYEILHYTKENKNATIIGDLTDFKTLPRNKVDCFICTQTFQFIYNFKDAIQGAYHILKEGGVLLATIAGISQVSQYDMDKWGDYWRFTTLSAKKSFEEIFGKNNVSVNSHGNVLTCIAFLEGISVEELSSKELDSNDDNFQLLITVVAFKKTR